MNKKLILPALASVFLFSCATKTATTSENSTKTIAVSPTTTGKKELTADYLAKGKTIYENSCAKCHNLPDPAKYSDQKWVGLVNAMAPKAKLSATQSEMVYDYVTSKN